MLSILQLVPYIILPFLFPELAPSLKLLAFAILFGLVVTYLIRTIIQKDHFDIPEIPLYWLYLLIAVFFVYMGIFNTGYLHQNWPILLGGLFFVFTCNYYEKSFLPGVLISIFFSWLFLLLSPFADSLIKGQFFHTAIVPTLPTLAAESQELLDNSFFLTRAVIPPQSTGFELLFHSCIILTTSYLFYFAYSKRTPIYTFLRVFLLLIWSSLLIILAGKTAFVLIAFYLTVFSLCCSPRLLLNVKNILSLIIIITALVACYFLNIDLLIYRSIYIEPYLHYFDITPEPLQLVGLLADGFNNLAYFTTYTEFLAILITAYCFYIGFKYYRSGHLDSSCLAFAISSLILLVIATISENNLPNLLTLLLHPIYWLSIIAMINRDDPADETHTIYFKYLPHSVVGLSAFLALFGFIYLAKDWQAQVNLEQYVKAENQEQELHYAMNAYQWESYRGDTASLFLTEYLEHLINQKQLPDEEKIRELDAAFYVSARSEYIPVEAYKLLSDLYLMHEQREQSIQILRVAASRYPDMLILHEFLADRLRQLELRHEAIKAYQVCTNIDPASPRLYKKLSTLYLELGENQEYERARDALITLDPSYQFN